MSHKTIAFYFKVFLWFFIASLLISVTIRDFIIPKFLSSQNDGNGLLIQTDSFRNHQLALQMAERMKSEGWAAWHMNAIGWGGAAISFTAIIYRYLGTNHFWIQSLNSLIHALRIRCAAVKSRTSRAAAKSRSALSFGRRRTGLGLAAPRPFVRVARRGPLRPHRRRSCRLCAIVSPSMDVTRGFVAA